MSVLKFGEEDDAIQCANNTEYRLAAGVFNKEFSRANRVIADWKLEPAGSITTSSRALRNAGPSSGVSYRAIN